MGLVSFVKRMPWQELTLCVALAIYAVFGSPTPDNFGFPETLVLFFLAVSLRPLGPGQYPLAWVFLVYGLSIPLGLGLLSGSNPASLLRDLIPFLFLFFPLFFGGKDAGGRMVLAASICSIGVAFSFRAIFSFVSAQDVLLVGSPPDLLYLANSPEVLFAAVYLLGGGVQHMTDPAKNRWHGSAMVLLGIFPIVAMGLMMQRASFGFLMLAGGIGFFALLWKNPKAALVVFAVFSLIAAGAWDAVSLWAGAMADKTRLVGVNSRVEEWSAVLRLVTESPGTAIFGLGWGAMFENPAVGGLPVLYTHNFFSALWLKTGLVGVFLGAIYIADLLRRSLGNLVSSSVFLAALAGPLLISGLLYASYKSLGFGLLLLMIFLVSGVKNREEKP
jgi:hypothetical protein